MEENVLERALGRARGRARGYQQFPRQPRRPGNEALVHPASVSAVTHCTHIPTTNVYPLQSDPAEVVTKEMAVVSLERENKQRESETCTRVSTRPFHVKSKKGTSGLPIMLLTNFFEVVSKPMWCVYQYHCDFAPVVESSNARREFIREHKEAFGNCYIFDGYSDLKTVKKLDKVTELFSQRKSDREKIRITVKHVAELAPRHPELGHLFNSLMRRNLQHSKYQLFGRHYFDPQAIKEIPEFHFQIWQGVTTSIRQQEEKLMMSVDTVYKVVRSETALEIIRQIINEQNQSYKEAVTWGLVGTVVMTRYNNRTYRVEDIDWSQTPSSTFDSREGTITYLEYYKKQYDISILDPKQPLLLCTSKEKKICHGGVSQVRKVYLVPELCFLTGLSESMRNNYSTMQALAKRTRLEPVDRVKNLQAFILRCNRNEEIANDMKAWGLKFANDLVKFQGRVMSSETIYLHDDHKAEYDQKSGDFSRELRGKPMLVAKNLDHWLVICTKYDEGKCNNFLANIYKACPPMGMEVKPPKVIIIGTDRINSYIQAFKQHYNRIHQMVVFIVPNNKKDRYDALKKLTCIDNAVPSQILVAKTLAKKQTLLSIATKVGVQINCKMGGEPWAVAIPFTTRIMVIGYDTYHDSSQRGHSAGGFVASLNQNCSRLFSKVSFHSTGGWEELSNHLKTHFIGALKKYHAVNNCVPQLIILYRDGIADGQIGYVKEWELKQFNAVIAECLKDQQTRSIFIIVNKKVNARFIAASCNSYENPPPGTVIDNTVTRYDRYDFFIVSQSVKHGTVSPTMYNVIEDSSGLKPDIIQRLTYKLTHLYYNWQGTIKVPCVCQYAHKLAYLAGQSLHQPPQEEFSNVLFYL